jgi:hypothetical protein
LELGERLCDVIPKARLFFFFFSFYIEKKEKENTPRAAYSVSIGNLLPLEGLHQTPNTAKLPASGTRGHSRCCLDKRASFPGGAGKEALGEVIRVPLQISSVEQLKRESEGEAEFFILLNYNLISRKRIQWDDEEKRFFIFNLIDDTEQVLTKDQLMDRGYTNIGYAITKGALYRKD